MANLSNFGDLKTRLATILGMDQAAEQTLLGEFINEAGSAIYHAHAWPRRRMYAILELEKSIDVDAATANLSGTEDSDVLSTGDGRNFSNYGEWKIARGGVPSAEWWWVNADHASTGAGAAKVNHTARETFSGEAYTLYKDEYPLPATVHSVLSKEMTLLGPDNSPLGQIHPANAAEFWADPTGFGVPRRFYVTSYDPSGSAQDENTSVGTSEQIRLRLGPLVCPSDEKYRIRYGYLRRWALLSDDADVPVLNYDLRPLIIEGALVLAYNYLDEFRDSATLIQRQERRYLQMLNSRIRNNRPVRPKVSVIRPFDKPSNQVGLQYTLPAED